MSGQQEPRRLPVVEANEQIDRAHRYLDLHAIKRVDEHGPDTLTGRIVELAEAAVLRAEEAEAKRDDAVRMGVEIAASMKDERDEARERVRSLEDAQAYAQGIVRRAIAGKLVDTYEWQRILDGYAPADAALAAGFPEDAQARVIEIVADWKGKTTARAMSGPPIERGERLFAVALKAKSSSGECA
jgi:hypothetical protein